MSHGIRHLLDRRIAHIVHVIAVACVELLLERQDGIHAVHVFLDLAHTPFLPGPHLGRYEIVYGNA